jgi:hypothetical protein
MVVAIVLITTVGRVLRARYGDTSDSRRSRRRAAIQAALQQPSEDSAEAARLKNEVARLNERIQVLERLATDPGKRLSDEIEALKHK